MKYGKLIEVKNIYPILSLLSDKSLDKLNDINKLLSGIKYARHQGPQKVNLPKETRFKFFKKLMETVPGFDKGDK